MKFLLIAIIFVSGFAGGLIAGAQQQAPPLPGERVTGIGGVFIQARDPKALAAWYRDALGLPLAAGASWTILDWRERAEPDRVGTTVWSLFARESTYFDPSEAGFMINYRVRDLDRMLAQLRAKGVRIQPRIADEFNGRFAWVLDPDGNKIELWEPKEGY